MPVRATKVVSGLLIDRFFGCGQWDALPVGKDGWAVVSVNCDTETPRSLRPYAEPVKYSPNAIDNGASSQVTIQGTSPIFATNQNGVVILTLQTSDVLATSTKVSVTNGGAAIVGPDDVGIDVVEANILLQNTGGLLPLVKISTSGAGSGNVVTYDGANIVWAAPATGSKWTDGASGSIYRNSNVGIGNAPTPTARLTIDAGTEFYPLLAYTNNNLSAWNIFANTDTSRPVGIALSEATNGGSLNFQIIRYGSTHATTPNQAEVRNVSNSPLALCTNNTVRLTIAAAGAVTLQNLIGTGTRLIQADSAGTLARSVLDPAALVVYTFENGLTNTAGTVRWGGTLTAATTITQGANAIRFTGNFTGIHKTTNNPTPRAVLTLDGLAVVPSTVAGPSEDAVMNMHGTTAGPTQTDTQISFGVNPTATDGAWIQGRSITSYTTPRQIKFQPRGGKEVHGSQSNFDPQFVFAGSGLGSTPGTLASVTLHVCNTGESGTRPKISLGTNNTILAGASHDSAALATRLFCMAGAGSVRIGVGGEDSDKVVIMPNSAGRLGAGFATTAGLHSTLQSSGSIAAAILGSPISAPTVDEDKHTMLWEANSNVTYTLPSPSTVVGRIYIIANFGTATLTIAVSGGGSISRGGGTFNTLTQGQWAWVQARAAGWVGYKITSL